MKFAVKQWVASIAVAVTTWSGPFVAQANDAAATIGYQGRLFDGAGEPLLDVKKMTFTLYDAKVGGRAVWSESALVEFDDGHFAVDLGEVTPLGSGLLDGKTRWLGISVSGGPERGSRAAIVGAATVAAPRSPAPVSASEPARPSGVVLGAAHVDADLGALPATPHNAFIGGTLVLTIEAAQHVHVSATAGLGSTAQGGAANLQLSVCARQVGAAQLIENVGDRQMNLAVAQNSRETFAVRSRFTSLAPGDYEFGLCGHVEAAADRWNHNGTSRVAVLVLAP